MESFTKQCFTDYVLEKLTHVDPSFYVHRVRYFAHVVAYLSTIHHSEFYVKVNLDYHSFANKTACRWSGVQYSSSPEYEMRTVSIEGYSYFAYNLKGIKSFYYVCREPIFNRKRKIFGQQVLPTFEGSIANDIDTMFANAQQTAQSAQPCSHTFNHPGMTCEAYDQALRTSAWVEIFNPQFHEQLSNVASDFVEEFAISSDPNQGYWPEDEEFVGEDDNDHCCLCAQPCDTDDTVCYKCMSLYMCPYCRKHFTEGDPIYVDGKGAIFGFCKEAILEAVTVACKDCIYRVASQTAQSRDIRDEFDDLLDKPKYTRVRKTPGSVKIAYSDNYQRPKDQTSVVARFSSNDEKIVESIKLDKHPNSPGKLKSRLRRQVQKMKHKRTPEPSLKEAYVTEFWNVQQVPQGWGDWVKGSMNILNPSAWTDALANTVENKAKHWADLIKDRLSQTVEKYGNVLANVLKGLLVAGGLYLSYTIFKTHPQVGAVMFIVVGMVGGFVFSEQIKTLVRWDSITAHMSTWISKARPSSSYEVLTPETAINVPNFDDSDLEPVKVALVGILACSTLGPDIYKLNPKGIANAVGKFPSVSKGVSELVPFTSELIISAVNKIRTFLGYERLNTMAEQHKQFGDWAKSANDFLMKAASNNLQVTHENMELLTKLLSEGRHHMMSIKELPQSERLKLSLSNILHQLSTCVSSFSQLGYSGAGARQMPLAIWIFGPSGIGKSCMVNRFGKVVLAQILPPERLERFLKNPDVETWSRQVETHYADGYFNQTLAVFDDIFQKEPNGTDSEAMEIIRMTNMYSHTLHMAGLLQKGNTMFTSTLIMASANDAEIMTSSKDVRHPEAVMRRFELKYRMELLPEYKTDKGFIDEAKVEAKGASFTGYCRFARYDMENGRMVDKEYLTFDEAVAQVVARYQLKMHQFKVYQKGTNELLVEAVKKNIYAKKEEPVPVSTDVSTIDEIITAAAGDSPFIVAQEAQGFGGDRYFETVRDLDKNDVSVYRNYTELKLCRWDNSKFDMIKARIAIKGLVMSLSLKDNVYDDLEWYRSIIVTIMTFIDCHGTLDLIWRYALFYMYKMSNGLPLAPGQWIYLFTCKNGSEPKTITEDAMVDLPCYVTKMDTSFRWEKTPVQQRASEWLGIKDVYEASRVNPQAWETFFVHNEHLCTDWNAKTNEHKKVVFNLVKHLSTRRPDAVEAKFTCEDVEALGIILRSEMSLFDRIKEWLWARLGQAYDFFANTWHYVLIVLGTLAAVVGLYFLGSWMYGKWGGPEEAKKPQEAESSHHKKDAQTQQRAKVIKPSDFAVAKNEANYEQPETISRLVWNNNYYRIFDNTGKVVLLHCIILYEKMVLTNYHLVALVKKHSMPHIYFQHQQGGPLIQMNVVDIFRSPEFTDKKCIEGDTLIFWADSCSFPTGKDIRRKFMKRGSVGISTDYPCILGVDRDRKVEVSRLTARKVPKPLPYNVHDLKFEFVALWFYKNSPTCEGDCGAPLFLDVPGPECIVGIHTASCSQLGSGSSVPIFQEDVYERCSKFSEKQGLPQIKYEVAVNGPNILMPDSPLETDFTDLSSIGVVLDVVKPFNQPRKSCLAQTPLFEKYGDSTKRPAKLGVCEVGEEVVNPKFKNLLENATVVPALSQSLVEHVTRQFLTTMGPIPGDPWYGDVENGGNNWKRTLTYEEAVAGIKGMREWHGIDRSTSSGYPNILTPEGLNGKRYYLGTGDEYDFKSEGALILRRRVDEIIEQLKRGERPNTMYADFLKDETLKNEKVDVARTRIIAADELAMVVVYRMYFGAIMIHFIKHRLFNSSAIGINPYGPEWKQLFHYLKSVGDKAFDGDYKFWDKFFLACLSLGIFDGFNGWYGPANPDNICRKVLGLNFAHAVHVVNKEKLPGWALVKLLEKHKANQAGKGPALTQQEQMSLLMHFAPGAFAMINACGFPSGNVLTAILNTVAGIVLSIISYGRSAGLHHSDWVAEWKKHIRMIGLGDDHIIAVSDAASKHYSALEHAKFVSSLGMQYTAADKTADLKPFTDWDKIVFLKRNFRIEDGIVYAPPSLETIRESTYWARKDPYNEKCKLNFQQQLYELSLHGEAVFNQIGGPMLKAYVSTFGVEPMECTYYKCLERAHYMDYYFGVQLQTPQCRTRELNAGLRQYISLNLGSVTWPYHSSGIHVNYELISALGGWSSALGQQRTASLDENAKTVTNSDTIETAGTTTFVNKGEVPQSQTSITLSSTDLLQHSVMCKSKPEDITAFLYKPIPVATGTLTNGNTQGQVITAMNCPDVFINDAQITEKVRGYQGIRGTMIFRLQVNSNPFQQGRYFLCAYPFSNELDPTYASRIDTASAIYNLTQLPRVEVDLSCDTEAMLEIPFVSQYQFSDLTLPVISTHRVLLVCYSKLKSGLGSTSVGYTIYASFKEGSVKLFNPTAPSFITAKQKAQSSMFDKEKEKAAKPSAVLRDVGNLTGQLIENVPVLAPLSKPVNWVSKFLSKGLSTFGFAKPIDIRPRNAGLRPGDLGDYAVTDGMCYGEQLGFTKENELQFYHDLVGQPHDEMAFDNILTKFSYLNKVEMTTSTAVGSVYSLDLSPEDRKSVV